MSSKGPLRNVRMLIINPNTSVSMTEALKPMVEDLGFPNVEYAFFTSPTPGIPSINSPADAAKSADICLPHILPLIPQHDAFLVACYSQHPLVGKLRSECAKLAAAATSQTSEGGKVLTTKYVNGIFEASITASLSLISGTQKFGIVSTGKVWEDALTEALHEFFGILGRSSGGPAAGRDSDARHPGSDKFIGCETTGLTAVELHDLPAAEVRAKMTAATKRLLSLSPAAQQPGTETGGVAAAAAGEGDGGQVRAICLGCAGMVGLDEAVRQACIDVLGPETGRLVCIVDGVKAGVASLVGLAGAGF